jgi:type II secretion system protein H
MGAKRRPSGFTLIELMLVLTIMAVMSAAIAPTLRGFIRGKRLPETAKLFSSSIRYCRSTAVHRSVRTRLIFETKTGRIRMEAESSAFTEPGVFVEIPQPSSLQEMLDQHVSEIQVKQMTTLGPEDVERLEFLPSGTVLGPEGRVTDTFIYLKGESETQIYTVAVVGITGQILVMDHEASTFYDQL